MNLEDLVDLEYLFLCFFSSRNVTYSEDTQLTRDRANSANNMASHPILSIGFPDMSVSQRTCPGPFHWRLNSQKKCDVGRHFWFCCIQVMWQRWVILPWHVTAAFAYFIFYFCNSFEFTNSNKKYWTQPTTTIPPSQSHEKEPKKSATTAAMATDTAVHCSGNFSCNIPLWLHWWVSPPSNNAGLFDCCEGWEGGYLAGRTSHCTARTMQKLKN